MKKVIITGISKGIGREILSHYDACGYKLFCIDNDIVSIKSLEQVYKNQKFYNCDLSKKNELFDVLNKIESDSEHKIDVLINNAATIKLKSFLTVTQQEWDSHIRINLDAYFYIAQIVGRVMSEKKTGHIINISSISSFLFDRNRPQLPYSTTKAAVDVMTKNMALELGSSGVRVNSIQPGFINCGMGKGVTEKMKIINHTPLKRMGEVEDLLFLLDFLISEKSSYITGQTIAVDGGYSLGI